MAATAFGDFVQLCKPTLQILLSALIMSTRDLDPARITNMNQVAKASRFFGLLIDRDIITPSEWNAAEATVQSTDPQAVLLA
jgi:hypothetical protein